MDFKHINEKIDKNTTPKTELNIFGKRISHGVNSDSPLRNMPNFSTPPSRFARIVNPFETHLIERLHLPTFSPNVFVQNSTPKTEQKFKWTIEDISSLKPADIDETTISQHVCTTDDPQIESLVQQKIETYFSEKEIAPSPLNVQINEVPLIKDCSIIEETPPKVFNKQTCEGSTQTVLTLPPILPKELEEALKPYFIYNQDQQEINEESMKNSSLYRQLFEFAESSPETSPQLHDDLQSLLSSPALSTGLSPIQFSPCSKSLSSPSDMPELKECNLSPISKNTPTKVKLATSVCRLSFSERMSVDASMIVPDMDNQQMFSKSYCGNDISLSPVRPAEISTHETTLNWSMEYKQVSLGSPTYNSDSDKMDVSNSNTPHSKLFTGQRKRLSESFKNEEIEEKENMLPFEDDISMQNRHKVFRNNLTDAGYHTQDTGDFSNNYSNVFASTPSKRKSKYEF